MASDDIDLGKERDGRVTQAERWISVTGSILIPVLISAFGFYFTTQQDEIETRRMAEQKQRDELLDMQRQQIEHTRQLIDLFTHPDDSKRQMGLDLFNYLLRKDLIPVEMEAVFISYATGVEKPDLVLMSDQNVPSTNSTNSENLQRAMGFAEKVKAIAKKARTELPPRVYFHVNDSLQRQAASAVKGRLEGLTLLDGKAMVVPSIDSGTKGPNSKELRFFKSSEKDEAETILSLLNAISPGFRLVDFSGRYETSGEIRPRHYEVWFGSDKIRVEQNIRIEQNICDQYGGLGADEWRRNYLRETRTGTYHVFVESLGKQADDEQASKRKAELDAEHPQHSFNVMPTVSPSGGNTQYAIVIAEGLVDYSLAKAIALYANQCGIAKGAYPMKQKI